MGLVSLTSDKHLFTVITNPKCACGTIKHWFYYVNNILPRTMAECLDQDLSPHDPYKGPRENWIDEKVMTQRVPPPDNYYRFIVVRNPWARLVSTFVEKVITKNSLYPGSTLHSDDYEYSCLNTKELTCKWCGIHGPTALPKDITFRQFVHRICGVADHQLDAHLIPQNSYYRGIKFNRVVKVENLVEDMDKVREDIGISDDFDFGICRWGEMPKADPADKVPEGLYDIPANQLKGPFPAYKHFYDQGLIDMVTRRYEVDGRFGYEYL